MLVPNLILQFRGRNIHPSGIRVIEGVTDDNFKEFITTDNKRRAFPIKLYTLPLPLFSDNNL